MSYLSATFNWLRKLTYDTSLTVKVRENLFLKRSFVQVTGTDGNTEGNSLLLGLTSNILEDGNGGVDTSSLEEKGSDSSS